MEKIIKHKPKPEALRSNNAYAVLSAGGILEEKFLLTGFNMADKTSRRICNFIYKKMPIGKDVSHNGSGSVQCFYKDIVALVHPIFKGFIVKKIIGFHLQIIEGEHKYIAWLSGSEQFRKTIIKCGTIDEIENYFKSNPPAC